MSSEGFDDMRSKLLHEYVSLVLSEGVGNIEGLALCVRGKKLTLWNPSVLLPIIQRVVEFDMGDDEFMDYVVHERMDSWVVGAIDLASKASVNHWAASEVRASVANKGYGPIMYDLAMELFGAIYADRESVSPAAEKVWDYYLKNRKDVKKLPFDDIDEPKTPPEIDDSQVYNDDRPALNYAYEGGTTGKAAELAKISKNAVKKIASTLGWSVNEVEGMIAEAGEATFVRRYFGR
jgi:hypothetical protein